MVSNKLSTETALQNCERNFSDALATFVSSQTVNRWLIAHSGGLDSQLLLHVAARHIPVENLLVVHVNHHLQPEADAWAKFSVAEAQALGVPSVVLDVHPESCSEQAARDARYAAIEQLMQSGDCMLFGHHADDQAETILYRLLRGTGLSGMSGMPVSRSLGVGRLLRPLLGCSRGHLSVAAEALNLRFIQDPSNQQLDYDRNFLRLKIFPQLKQRWPGLLERWQANADHVAEADVLLQIYLDRDLKKLSSESDQLDLELWQQLELVRRKALLRFWVNRVGRRRLNEKQVAEIVSSVIEAKPDANPVYKLKDVWLGRFQNKLHLFPGIVEVKDNLSLEEDGEYDLGDGVLTVFGLPAGEVLKIRRRQGGENCCPVGRGATKSVKKLLQEAVVPPWFKERWPLIFRAEQIVSVPGICICEERYAEKGEFSVLWRPFSLSDLS